MWKGYSIGSREGIRIALMITMIVSKRKTLEFHNTKEDYMYSWRIFISASLLHVRK